MNNSPIWTLNWQDFAKGAVVAVMSAVIDYVMQVLTQQGPVDPMLVLNVATIAFLGYLAKNLTTTADGQNLVVTGIKKLINK